MFLLSFACLSEVRELSIACDREATLNPPLLMDIHSTSGHTAMSSYSECNLEFC